MLKRDTGHVLHNEGCGNMEKIKRSVIFNVGGCCGGRRGYRAQLCNSGPIFPKQLAGRANGEGKRRISAN
jgi:hypothetical protein